MRSQAQKIRAVADALRMIWAISRRLRTRMPADGRAPQAPKATSSAAQRSAYATDPRASCVALCPADCLRPQSAVPSGITAQPKQGSSGLRPDRRMQQSSVADTLQHSRERVAARWFALKGVFEQPGQEQQETPVRQKETRTPVLAVFSLAGGVGQDQPGGDAGPGALFDGREGVADGHDLARAAAFLLWGERTAPGCGEDVLSAERKHGCADLPGEL